MPMGREESEFEARRGPTFNEKGGVELHDDGSGRLRDKRPTDYHPDECACIHCRQLCCVLCHDADPSITQTRRSLTGFGKHLASFHPKSYSFERNIRKTKRLVNQLQELQVAKQAQRFERTGLRRVPIKEISERDLKTLAEFVRNARRGNADNGGRGMDPLLLTAIEVADDRFKNQKQFESAIRRLTMEIERGTRTGTLTTSQRTTHFDPRVAIEILKVCWATGRGWSFVVHLLLLYGLNAFCEGLATEGLVPPTTVPSVPKPAEIVNSVVDFANEVMDGGK